MVDKNKDLKRATSILTEEQEEVLDLYLQKLNQYIENLEESEKMEVDIETMHLKRILST